MKKRILLLFCTALMLLCAGCSGPAWDRMEEKGAELMEQGREVNRELMEKSREVNQELMEKSQEVHEELREEAEDISRSD